MAINYSINGRSIPTVPSCEWQPIMNTVDNQNVKGYSNWERHIWIVPTMRVTDFQYLDNLKGSEIISLVSSSQTDHNVEATYSDARMINVEGSHIGHVIRNARIEMLVKVS